MSTIKTLYDEAKLFSRKWRQAANGYKVLMSKWEAYGDAGEQLRQALPVKTHVSYAYSPRENVGSGGSDHIVLEEDFTQGRLTRKAGDALCKSSKKFWGLTALNDGKPANCLKCLEIAEKLNV